MLQATGNSHRIFRAVISVFTILGLSADLVGQQQPVPPAPGPAPAVENTQAAYTGYVLGPNDIIVIRAQDAEEISNRPITVDGEGYINVPQMGRIRAAGLTLTQIQNEIVERLKPYIRSPQVTVTVTQMRSDLVFLIGAFTRPGTYPYHPKRKLSELLSMVGGVLPAANRRVKLTRQLEYGPIPLPNAVEDPERKVSEAEIDVRRLIQNINSPEDLLLRPSDVITAALKEKIYVSGMVTRPGAVDLEERESMTVSQVLSVVGMLPDARPEKAVVLRPIMDSNRRSEIPVNAKRILEGRASDFPLLPNDVLYVPAKRSLGRFATVMLPTMVGATGTALIYVLLRDRGR